MPIEIKELVIRATIEGGADEKGSAKKDVDREAIITECVEQVMKILRMERER